MTLEKLVSDPRVDRARLGDPDPEGRCVVYWMQRSQRGLDNHALNVAIEAANALELPLAVHFGLHPGYPRANRRHYHFLAQGLPETARRIRNRGAHFVFRPYPDHDLIRFCDEVRPALVVGDENPMREPAAWRRRAAKKLRVPFWIVDADVIVPTRLFPKEEYAARTLRPKIHKELERFLSPPGNPRVRKGWRGRKKPWSCPLEKGVTEPSEILEHLPSIPRDAEPVDARGGTSEALRHLRIFCKERLDRYHEDRNAPHLDGTSELSAYLHFGQIGPHTIVKKVKEAGAPRKAEEAYLEELIVRRELAINFVARNRRYDTLAGCHRWAIENYEKHGKDERPVIYSTKQLENAETHDRLWNAAQIEMVRTGRMHGYMRMYWAKKILEWTPDPATAFEIAVNLNDRYELDGRDPNGYTGIAWAIGGKHDRPWGPRRPIFGTIRYMSGKSLERKIDGDAYIRKARGK